MTTAAVPRTDPLVDAQAALAAQRDALVAGDADGLDAANARLADALARLKARPAVGAAQRAELQRVRQQIEGVANLIALGEAANRRALAALGAGAPLYSADGSFGGRTGGWSRHRERA